MLKEYWKNSRRILREYYGYTKRTLKEYKGRGNSKGILWGSEEILGVYQATTKLTEY